MEISITENPPSVCLNMIVKNESHIIYETLEMLTNKIDFSYWVICDTGSTDNTVEIIETFFKEKDIPGKIFKHEWKNFAHNRNLALNAAFGKTDLLFIFDADDEIHGTICIPQIIDSDGYLLKFGSNIGASYCRTLLISNKNIWEYKSVIHEFIDCLKPNHKITMLQGDYYIVSGRKGSRSFDPDKYLKDALILEAAYTEAKSKNDMLYLRYGFYCANSYKDCGKNEEAIKWYKITLSNDNWYQEKYMSCLNIFYCYKNIGQNENGIYYLIESFKYDTERVECLYYLMEHYLNNNMSNVAYQYYVNIRDFYENRYLNANLEDKLFLQVDKYTQILPFKMIFICDKVKEQIPEAKKTIAKMFEIIFTKKCQNLNECFTGNTLHNLQFFIDDVIEYIPGFIEVFKSYIDFLESQNFVLNKYDFMKKYEKYGIFIKNTNTKPHPTFSLEECKSSNKILFYTGFNNIQWNYTYSLTNSLGGSETAVAYLVNSLPKSYDIYVAGDVKEENFDNIKYINANTLKQMIKNEAFHTVIVSRYLSFYELFSEISFFKSFIWGHDINLFNYGCALSVNEILLKWDDKITGCICQTEWHMNLFKGHYPILNNKFHIINNGILTNQFPDSSPKMSNRFIYTSCAERGLERLLELWPKIVDNLPDAELFISSYNLFPQNDFQIQLETKIKKYDNIKHMGRLNKSQLYDLMSTAEYWLYPTDFSETSCITSMEMLMSNIICLYYPIAGLNNTLGEYGIVVTKNNEIDAILDLSIKQKVEIKRKGKEYALTCSWDNRAKQWCNLFLNEKILSNYEKRMFELFKNFSMPIAHIKMLKVLSESFTPKIIYDIGANVLHWTREAQNVWNNSTIYAFDAISEAVELYKSQKINYHIGVLSDEDNKIVRFYENKENPAGNSYYKEIGHINSNNIFPENSFTEQNSMTLSSVVKKNGFPYPDLIKIDVQGSELDIIKGGLDIINKAKYLIIELQSVEYNRGAPLAEKTIDYLNSNGWEIVEAKFSDNGPDADYLFINTKYEINIEKEINDYKIKIVNLERRPDRKSNIISQLETHDITNYDFFEAVDGMNLQPDIFIWNLFKNNNFNYRKGVIGCALSHYFLWYELINDNDNNYYVILEDDIILTKEFNKKLEKTIEIIKENNIEYALIGGYQIENECINLDINFTKIVSPICSGAFGYVISKTGCYKLINYLNTNGITGAIDWTDLYTNCLDMYRINKYLATTSSYQISGNTDTDIQLNYEHFTFDNIPTFSIAFTDWWIDEYCGGIFVKEHNFFIDLLSKYCNIKVINAEENPDILFYSVFGTNHTNLEAKRKIFYSGEAISQSSDADFNITFDEDSDKNCRLPLWVCYLNEELFNNIFQKKQALFHVPKKAKFCSIICQQDDKDSIRSNFIETLSKYKKVDCGGKLLNNIGYTVPRGINCSGKIEHNIDYKFAIAFENQDYTGYVTEKICDIYKSNCIPIYWGTKLVVNDFNPSTFINANDFENFDKLVEYIIKVDNDDTLYASYFKEPIFTKRWLDILFYEKNKTFFKNLADNIIGKNSKLLDNNSKISIYNIWHNKLFDDCYNDLDQYSLDKIVMYDVNPLYEKIYNKDNGYQIMREYELPNYNSLLQTTNYCQTSCFYHIYKNKLHLNSDYVGFIQYDMILHKEFIYDMEYIIQNNKENKTLIFYHLLVDSKIHGPHSRQLCEPYFDSLLEKYNIYFCTNHTYQSILQSDYCRQFICLHTFVIPQKLFEKMMSWFTSIIDWLHTNYINNMFNESISELTEEIFGLFFILQMIEDDTIVLYPLKLTHEWPNLHNQTQWNDYKSNSKVYYSLNQIADNTKTDKNSFHSYLDTYDKLFKHKQLSCKNVLEIGIQRSGSIKLWNDYFVNATIYGLDVDPAPQFLSDFLRVKTYRKNAYDNNVIDDFIKENIKFDIIIDDGPHSLESIIYTVKNYSKILAPEGILVIEDVQHIEWCDILKQNTPAEYLGHIEVFDLRANKNRRDDILYVIDLKKKKILNLSNKCSKFSIFYGIENTKIDITNVSIDKCSKDGIITIPPSDETRGRLFGDPIFGIEKTIFITDCFNNEYQFSGTQEAKITIDGILIT